MPVADTVDPTHGAQCMFNSYYDTHCYLPLHIYEEMAGKLILTVLRQSANMPVMQSNRLISTLVPLDKADNLHGPPTLGTLAE